MAILKKYHRPTGSRNWICTRIFSEINIFIAVRKIYALISSAESDELYIEIIYVYFTPSHLKKSMHLWSVNYVLSSPPALKDYW